MIKLNTATKGQEEFTLSHGGNYVMNVNAADGLKLRDDKIELRPVDTLHVLGNSGADFVLRVDNTGGLGQETFTAKASSVTVVPGNALSVRNKDDTLDLLALSTTDKQGEVLDVVLDELRLHNGAQSVVSSVTISSNVATVVHDGQITSLAQGGKVQIRGCSDAQCNGIFFVKNVVDGTSFTVDLVASDAACTGGTLTHAAYLTTSPAGGTVMYDDKVEISPTNYFRVSDPSISPAGGLVGDVLRVETADGIAAGTIASDTTSVFASANTFKTVGLSVSLDHRNRDDTRSLLHLDALESATQNKERLSVDAHAITHTPTGHFTVRDAAASTLAVAGGTMAASLDPAHVDNGDTAGHALRVTTAATPLILRVQSVVVTGMSLATVHHADTGSVRLVAGDVVTFTGLAASGTLCAGLTWTVTGAPTRTEFTFSTTEAGRVSLQSGTYLPAAASGGFLGTRGGRDAMALDGDGAYATIAMVPLVVSSVLVPPAPSNTATVTHDESFVPVQSPLTLSVQQVVIAGGVATVTHGAVPAGATTTKLVKTGDLVTLAGFTEELSSIVSVIVDGAGTATVTHSGGLGAVEIGDKVTVVGNSAGNTDGTYTVTGVDSTTIRFVHNGVAAVYASGTIARTTVSVLNAQWTVTGVPSSSSFTFNPAESGRASPPDATYTESGTPRGSGGATTRLVARVRFALAISGIVVSGNVGGALDGSVVATATHTSTASVARLMRGQRVTISGLSNNANTWANGVWTVTGTPTDTTFTFDPTEGLTRTSTYDPTTLGVTRRIAPGDGALAASETCTGLADANSAAPRLQAGAIVTLSGMATSPLNAVWTVTGIPSATSFTFSLTESGRTKPGATTHSPSGANAAVTAPVTWSSALEHADTRLATTASLVASGERVDLVAAHAVTVTNGDGTAAVLRVDTTTRGNEAFAVTAAYNTIGTAGDATGADSAVGSLRASENLITGRVTRIAQTDSNFRTSAVLTVDDESGFVVTDDKSTITPLKYHRVTSDGGLLDMFRMNTDSYASISLNSDGVTGGCQDTTYTTEEACTNVGAWTPDACSNPAYTTENACTNKGTWSSGNGGECAPINNGGREVGELACQADAGVWSPGVCRVQGVIVTDGGRHANEDDCEAPAALWAGGDTIFAAGDTFTNQDHTKRGFVYEATSGGSLKYVLTAGTLLTHGEKVTTLDGDSATCSGSSSTSNMLTGTLSTPDGFFFDAMSAKDTTVTIRNTFSSSGLPGAGAQDRTAKLVMRSSDAQGSSEEVEFKQEVCGGGSCNNANRRDNWVLRSKWASNGDVDRIRVSGKTGAGQGSGDIYHNPESNRMDYHANNMHFSINDDVTFDQDGTCAESCGFHINPTNRKITTTANTILATDSTGTKHLVAQPDEPVLLIRIQDSRLFSLTQKHKIQASSYRRAQLATSLSH